MNKMNPSPQAKISVPHRMPQPLGSELPQQKVSQHDDETKQEAMFKCHRVNHQERLVGGFT
jgi:hypothetical protein